MATSLVLASLLFAQATPAITVEAPFGVDDVGYRELIAQRPADAIARIEANRTLEVDDPAAQINLGTAKARLGDHAAAIGHYRAAIASRQRYDLELADGNWMDSRAAGRLAVRMLAKGDTLALR
jgi:hypothetical protein